MLWTKKINQFLFNFLKTLLFHFDFVIKYSQSFWQLTWDSSIYCGVCYYDCRRIQDLACWEQKQRGVQCLSEHHTSYSFAFYSDERCVFIGTTLITIKCKLITQAISLVAASRGGHSLGQWFSTTILEPCSTAQFTCLLNQKHLIQVLSSLVETPGPEIGMSDKGAMQNVQCWGDSMNMVENHRPKGTVKQSKYSDTQKPLRAQTTLRERKRASDITRDH